MALTLAVEKNITMGDFCDKVFFFLQFLIIFLLENKIVVKRIFKKNKSRN